MYLRSPLRGMGGNPKDEDGKLREGTTYQSARRHIPQDRNICIKY